MGVWGGGGGRGREGDGIEKQVAQQERNHLCPFSVSVDTYVWALLPITLFLLTLMNI